jgi:hypothetical protein
MGSAFITEPSIRITPGQRGDGLSVCVIRVECTFEIEEEIDTEDVSPLQGLKRRVGRLGPVPTVSPRPA